MATSQIALIIGGLVVAGLVLNFIKGVVKFAVLVVIVLGCLFAFNKLSPDQVSQIKNLANSSTQTIQQVTDMAKNSDSVKIDTANGNKVSIKVGNEWVNVSDIAQVKSISKDGAVVVIKGKEIKVTDESVIKILDLVQSQK